MRRHQPYAATDNFGYGQLNVVETLGCSCSHLLRRFSSSLVFQEVGVRTISPKGIVRQWAVRTPVERPRAALRLPCARLGHGSRQLCRSCPKLAVGLFTFVDVHPRNNNFNNLQRNQNKILFALQKENLIRVTHNVALSTAAGEIILGFEGQIQYSCQIPNLFTIFLYL